MNKLRVGMVGNGFIADWHHAGFLKNADAQITGMCRIIYGNEEQKKSQIETLFEKCNEWDIKPYENFEAIVSDPEIDALIIGTINPYHYEQIKTAISEGKHILVEKPVVTDFNQLEEIIKLGKEKNIKIFPGHNFAYRNAVRMAKEIISEGRLGQIIHSSFTASHRSSESHSKGWRAKRDLAKGGALMDSGHHLIYQSLYLLGKPKKIHGYASSLELKNMECEDTAQVSLLYPDGSIANIMQSWASGYSDMINGIRILGTKGSIIITDALYFNNIKINDNVEYLDSFINQAKSFSDYILKDIPLVSDLDDVRDTLKIIFAAYESAEKESVLFF